MEYMSVTEAAEKWGISDRRVRVLCEEGRISGTMKIGRSYKILIDAIKPFDNRAMRGIEIPQKYRSQFEEIDAKQRELNSRRSLTQGELQRLQEEFLIDFTYNSNAIEGSSGNSRA